jgi:hypothetical protein
MFLSLPLAFSLTPRSLLSICRNHIISLRGKICHYHQLDDDDLMMVVHDEYVVLAVMLCRSNEERRQKENIAVDNTIFFSIRLQYIYIL